MVFFCLFLYVVCCLMFSQMHGAGLVNTLYLPPHSSVIEMISESTMDSRHFPFAGIFPRLSVVAAFHHYTLILPANVKTNMTDDALCAEGSSKISCRVNFDPSYIQNEFRGFWMEKQSMIPVTSEIDILD